MVPRCWKSSRITKIDVSNCQFSSGQIGSRFIQQKLETASSEIRIWFYGNLSSSVDSHDRGFWRLCSIEVFF